MVLTRVARGSRVRRPATLAFAILLMLFAPPAHPVADEADELEAAFISKLALFVQWPDGAFASADAPIRVGILGEDPSSETLTAVLAKARTLGRSYQIDPAATLEEAGQYHILVVNETGQRTLQQIARNLKGVSVLSIAKSFTFAQDGGVLGIEIHKGKVAFQVNDRAARRANLRISSRLLRLATAVY